MPNINAIPHTMQNGDRVIQYQNTVGVIPETFIFDNVQETVNLYNKGNDLIHYAIGVNTGDLAPSETVTLKGSFSSVTLNANSKTQHFSLWAEESGSLGVTPEAIQGLNVKIADLQKSIEEGNGNGSSGAKKSVVFLGDFQGENNEVKIQEAIDYASANSIKTVLLEDVTYIISGTINVKQNVKLIGGYGTSFTVYGLNYSVLDIKKNASVEGFKINIDDNGFTGNVILLDGSNRYYNSWNRTAIKDLAIIDWNDYRKCKGIKLLADGSGDEISFLEFKNIKLTNLNVGISVEVKKPTSGMAYVNANLFDNITLEGCNEMINISSDISVPNEFTGNIFTNLQVQPSYATQKLFTINGGYNTFEGMIWDLHLIPHSNSVIFLTAASERTRFNMQNMPFDRVSNLGNLNDLGRQLILESRTSDPTVTVVGQMWFRSDL